MLVKDKVVVVSGIGPGLGNELALAAAREGATAVVLAARTPAKLEEAAKQVAALGLGTQTLQVPTDIADAAACKQLVAKTVEKFGRVDALINSAYIPGKFGNWEKWDFADWRKTLDVNLIGSLQLSREAALVMKDQPDKGSIVFVNSMVTKKVISMQAGYATSKGALTIAMKAMAQELAPLGIRVNGVYMGWMWGANVKGYCEMMATKMNTTTEAIKQGFEKGIPLGVMPTDKECALPCLFLASDYAKVMTGAMIDVNGGEYMPIG